MPEQNTRIVIRGVPRADKEFHLFEISREEAQRMAKLLVSDEKKLLAEIKRSATFRGGVRR